MVLYLGSTQNDPLNTHLFPNETNAIIGTNQLRAVVLAVNVLNQNKSPLKVLP